MIEMEITNTPPSILQWLQHPPALFLEPSNGNLTQRLSNNQTRWKEPSSKGNFCTSSTWPGHHFLCLLYWLFDCTAIPLCENNKEVFAFLLWISTGLLSFWMIRSYLQSEPSVSGTRNCTLLVLRVPLAGLKLTSHICLLILLSVC